MFLLLIFFSQVKFSVSRKKQGCELFIFVSPINTYHFYCKTDAPVEPKIVSRRRKRKRRRGSGSRKWSENELEVETHTKDTLGQHYQQFSKSFLPNHYHWYCSSPFWPPRHVVLTSVVICLLTRNFADNPHLVSSHFRLQQLNLGV